MTVNALLALSGFSRFSGEGTESRFSASGSCSGVWSQWCTHAQLQGLAAGSYMVAGAGFKHICRGEVWSQWYESWLTSGAQASVESWAVGV